ncbi:MAG: TrmH family RNA methyltransferase [Erysipelotrichaceae bacterium]
MEHVFEGNIAVKAAIQAQRRTVLEVIVDEKKHDKDTKFIIGKAHELGLTVTKKTRAQIDAIAKGKTHGGVLARVEDISYVDAMDYANTDFIALVEGIEDPFNFGYICRSLYAAGCKMILVQERNWMESADVVAKSSAGASEYLPMAIYSEETLLALKAAGFQFVCGNRKDATDVFEADLSGKILLGVGGEMRGLSKNVAALADLNVFIPYENDFRNSLNGASATSVLAFEIFRQKRKNG